MTQATTMQVTGSRIPPGVLTGLKTIGCIQISLGTLLSILTLGLLVVFGSWVSLGFLISSMFISSGTAAIKVVNGAGRSLGWSIGLIVVCSIALVIITLLCDPSSNKHELHPICIAGIVFWALGCTVALAQCLFSCCAFSCCLPAAEPLMTIHTVAVRRPEQLREAEAGGRAVVLEEQRSPPPPPPYHLVCDSPPAEKLVN